MAWTNIANANLDVGAPIRSVDILALRDNITALANGDTGAPPIKAPALGGGQTGNAPIFAARAWVNFNGQNAFTPNPSTSAIRGSGNVSSITREGVGKFFVNLSVALPDTNVAVGVSIDTVFAATVVTATPTSTSAINVWTFAPGGNFVNTNIVSVIAFR